MQCDDISSQYLTLVDAIKALADNSDVDKQFSIAQSAFIKAEKAVVGALSDLQLLEELESKKRKLADMHIALAKQEFLYKKCLSTLSKLQHECLPWWHYRILKACKMRDIIKTYKPRVDKQKNLFVQLKSDYDIFSAKLTQEIKACAVICKVHYDVVFAQADINLDSSEIQRKAFGHSTQLNLLRSQLSACAFELHQAWLVASYKSGFSQTINKLPGLLQNKIALPADAKIMWQCLFMVCPVVSSAFASVANQFSKLGQGDIGWLFIDESGQATPPQAIGALLRAKHAVVVGDPLQIEPVFTTPPDIVEYLGRRLLKGDWQTWSPSVVSVQELADRANPFGTKKIAIGKWLGSPLRVHRRCSDPMFSISNQIAYNNKMMHGLNDITEQEPFVWGPSGWFDVKGNEKSKHYVPKQAEHVLSMLYKFVERYKKLPDCYIISPFSNVKFEVNSYLNKNFNHKNIQQADFNAWLEGRVGTVHTFQGKEEELVIFILGASDSAGAANWAAGKPNLLNVAVTRAKKRVYLIGCYKRWSALPHFEDAFGLLNESIID
ncbi:conserved hypothetical protein [Psychromonas ingrahamii 37]|uniref:Uncharacterized protein n=2 Tax=Psychromonas ingrahamii TaxID=357794 RepID=A1SW09_PSYIN|nr:conserved hypothetical protein [Psychromonas ingrahamii 37]